MGNHNKSKLPAVSSVDCYCLRVKEKIGGIPTKKTFQVQLQGEVLWALEKRAKELGLSGGVYVRDLIEKDLVRSEVLPGWWFSRNRRVRP